LIDCSGVVTTVQTLNPVLVVKIAITVVVRMETTTVKMMIIV
jgi:hypothetical protein